MTDKAFELVLGQISDLKGQLDGYKVITKPLEEKLEAKKFEAMQHMQDTRSKRTEAVDGYYVIRAERKSLSIADNAAVEAWLVENKFDLDEYKKLDAALVKATAESTMKMFGEIVPGVEVSSTEYLVIKAV